MQVLNASEFSGRLADLLQRERTGMADFLVALADFDGACLYELLDYKSLFMYLHRELRLSKAAAYYRMTAAGLVRKYPELVEPLRDGRLCMTAIVSLARVVTPENRAEVVPRFFGLSKSEAQELAASMSPAPDPPLRDVVTPLSPVGVVRPGEPRSRAGAGCGASAAGPGHGTPSATGGASDLDLAVTAALDLPGEAAVGYDPAATLARALSREPRSVAARSPEPPPDDIEPVTAALARLHVTVSRRFLDKLEAARDARSHAQPGATLADILEAGLDRLIAERDRRNGLVKKPRATPPPSGADAIPAHVKRAVWKRDGGRCQWRLPNGQICGSTRHIQFDHTEPRALGGKSTVENVRLLCGPHNRLAARRILGDACMGSYLRRPKRLEVRHTGVGPGGG